ncbi:rhodanese-like domain-containing protein [Salinimicrobium flavum]|uniref:Rhodanese-like domain-containing protein n=1 Tax=Salinimicrobium flavum TaxID=1737065 RepID=A0ABW5IXH2_9FLAO
MNRRKVLIISFLSIALIAFVFQGFLPETSMPHAEEEMTQQEEVWNEDQLLEPAQLAATLNDPQRTAPVIIDLGAGGAIKGSVEVGETRFKTGMDNLKKQVENLPKDADIVIYCGCCPFENCPNIRPAFGLLNDMAFENHKLLNLTRNIKVDWFDKGYPVN